MKLAFQRLEEHTFAMNPQERPFRLPLFERVAFQEPCCSSAMVRLPNRVVVH